MTNAWTRRRWMNECRGENTTIGIIFRWCPLETSILRLNTEQLLSRKPRMQIQIQSVHFALNKRKIYAGRNDSRQSGEKFTANATTWCAEKISDVRLFLGRKLQRRRRWEKNRAAAHAVAKHPIEEPHPTTLTPTWLCLEFSRPHVEALTQPRF